RKPADISVNDVVSAIEGPVSVTNCCNASATRGARVPGDGSTHCRIQGRCPISISVRGLNRQIGDYLSHVTLADLMRNDGRPFASSEPTSLHPASGSLKEEAQ
ncbi:MAG: hypothetical protein KJ927_14160, partial [Candidatus Eisenbacteria bacterium]|nr:hypothetical protein [Candidatus Eisenbacteria bacterium]